MRPKSDEKEAGDEEEATCPKKAAQREASLTTKSQLEEIYLNQLKYVRADLENLQKNIERRINEGVSKEKEKLIAQLLQVAEELDLAVEEARKEANTSLLEGIEMVKRKLWNILYSEGLSSIEAVGHPFDPHFHEALFELETSDHPEGTVIEEVRKGYLMKEKVLKPSMVKVASRPGHNSLKGNEP